MKRTQVCVNLEPGLLEMLDIRRGDVSRSRAIRRCLEKAYGKTEQPQKNVGGGS